MTRRTVAAGGHVRIRLRPSVALMGSHTPQSASSKWHPASTRNAYMSILLGPAVSEWAKQLQIIKITLNRNAWDRIIIWWPRSDLHWHYCTANPNRISAQTKPFYQCSCHSVCLYSTYWLDDYDRQWALKRYVYQNYPFSTRKEKWISAAIKHVIFPPYIAQMAKQFIKYEFAFYSLAKFFTLLCHLKTSPVSNISDRCALWYWCNCVN